MVGGKSHQLVVELLGVGAGQPAEAGDGGAADTGEPSGLADATTVGDVGQHGLGFVRGQAGVEQWSALALGEACLAGAAVEQAALVRAVAGADGEVAVATLPVIRTGGLQAAELAQVVHRVPILARRRWQPGYEAERRFSTLLGHHPNQPCLYNPFWLYPR